MIYRGLIAYYFILIFGISCAYVLEEIRCIECKAEIPSSAQREGNVAKGRDYLLYGDFVDSGIPSNLFINTLGAFLGKESNLSRAGINSGLNYAYTRFINKEGVDLVAPNCFQCHAGKVGNQFILGLGNMAADFTSNQAGMATILDQVVINRYGEGSKEYNAYLPFSRAIKVLGDKMTTEVIGANSADKLALILAAHRNQKDLTWTDEPNFLIPDEVHPVDVPAWWLLKKKNAMFHTGEGRGDFARLMMASSLLTLQDSSKAREVDLHFADVKAFILSLSPPKYPQKIDEALASNGELIFNAKCAKCHGTYGPGGTYPNLLISLDEVGTDGSSIEFYRKNKTFVDWYNDSWFSKPPFSASLLPGNGYIAPPLDGVWATAPYFHNGSVPTLESVLDASLRPEIWQKSGSSDNYDPTKMGLKYVVVEKKTDALTYDTSMKGYGNGGHYYGNVLSQTEKLAILEYLKVL